MGVMVRTAFGSVEGTRDDGVHAFKGIPYAAPPVGARRFRAPVPPETWDGARDASRYGLVARQQPMPGIFGEYGTPPNPAGDDCLNLNVWTPDPGRSGLPVLVWIHGGAFYAGSGIDDVYNGSRFARDGVVTVSLNYRLGAQGFWNLADDFPELADSGNLGLLDQVAALEWVQDNISAFGGDPSQVTIAGESAGGMSVTTLLATPPARGLFRRGVPQSGAGHNGISAPTAANIGRQLLDLLGVRPGDLDALASIDDDALLNAQAKLNAELGATRDPERFGEAAASAMSLQPTYGTDVLPQRPIDAIAAGVAADIELLVGTTKEEALIFLVDLAELFDEATVTATMNATFGGEAAGERALDVYRRRRPGARPHELVAAIETDRMFTVPALRLADAQVRHQPNVWMYRFDWRTPIRDGAHGAHHFLEVPFAFDQLDNPQARGFAGDHPPQALADAAHAAWVAFATNGDPATDQLPP